MCGGERQGKGLRKKKSTSRFGNATQSLRQYKNLTLWPDFVLSTYC